MLKVDTKDVQKLVDALREVSRSAYPLTVRSTLNRLAYDTKELSSNETIPHTFTTRNTFIQKSVQYERSENTFSIGAMEARAGQVSDYLGKKTDQLEKQEYGQPVVAKGKHLFTPTITARGGDYKKPVLRRYHFPKLEIKTLDDLVEYPTKNPFLEIKQACGYARRNNETFNIIARSPRQKYGIFNIVPGKVRNKAQMIYSIGEKSRVIDKTRWLDKTAKTVGVKVDEIFLEEAKKRIEKELAKKLKRL